MFRLSKKFAIFLSIFMFLLSSCGVVDGPSDADLKSGAKQALLKSPDNGKLDEAVKKELTANLEAMTVARKGICNVQKEVYNCAAEVTFKTPGAKEAETKTVMIPMKKGSNGWELTKN